MVGVARGDHDLGVGHALGRRELIAISTAKGANNYFAKLWRNAQPGAEHPNGFHPIFIPSSAHPWRDKAWLTAAERRYPDRHKFMREHPESPSDAFVLSDEAVFSEFERERHLAKLTQIRWPVWHRVDFGYHFSPVYWAEVQANRVVHFFYELDARGMTTDQLAQAIVQIDRRLGLKESVPTAVDPAGGARTSQSGTESDHNTLRRHGLSDLREISPACPRIASI